MRFTELKKDPSQIGEVDGEIVDANAIETALKLANVNLRDASGQFRNFDDVILDLSANWENLDTNTKRYIATQAAGSRQQSRFLALLSDNERLTQLTEAAYNSAGASQQQFNKTLDSMETKLTQLINAWDVFTRNLMNSDLLKTGIDILTNIITVINSITNVFSNISTVLSSAFSITIISAFFTMAKKGITSMMTLISTRLKQQTTETKAEGTQAGTGYGEEFGSKANERINTWLTRMQEKIKAFAQQAKAEVASIMGTDVAIPEQPNKPEMGSREWYESISAREGIKKGKTGVINLGQKGLTKEEKEAIKQYEIANGMRDKSGKVVQQTLDDTGKAAEKSEKKIGSLSRMAQVAGGSFMALGVATNLFAQVARKAGAEEGAEIAEIWGGVLTTAGSFLYVLPNIIDGVKKLGLSFGSASLTAGVLMAAIAGLAFGISTIIKAASKNTLEGKLKSITTQTEQAVVLAQKAQEGYSNWLNDKNEYTGLVDTLEELTEGTEAWNTKMDELQDKIYELINSYPELAQYLQSDGTLSDEGVAIYEKKLKEQKELTTGTKTMLQMSQAQLQYEKDVADVEKQRAAIGDDVANAKIQELETTYKNTTAGYMNVMGQNSGTNGNVSKYTSQVLAKQKKQDDLANQVQNHYTGNTETLVTGIGTTALGVAGAGTAITGGILGGGATIGAIATGLMAIPVAGWIAAGALAAGGATAAIIAGVKKNAKKKELQETYSELFDIPVDEISDEIKNDTDALATQIVSAKAYQSYIREMASIEQELSTLGSKGSKLLSADMSLLDFDFINDGDFDSWAKSSKGKVGATASEVIDEAVSVFNAERKKVKEAIDDIFSGKVKMQIDIDDSFAGLIISGENAQKLYEAREKLNGSKFFTQTLDDVLNAYGAEQIEVNRLTESYIELADTTTTTQKAMAAKKMFESNITSVQKLGAEFMTTNSAMLSATNQIKEFYMNLSTDDMNTLYQNGKLTVETVMEMGESFSDLVGIVDTTDINFATLADTLNDVKSGVLSLDSLTNSFVETLDALNKGTHSIEDTLANAKAYTDPDSGTLIGEKTGTVAQSLLELVAEGRYGDPALETYFDFLFGEEAWDNALAQAKGNAEEAMSQYKSYIATMAEKQNYFDIWAGTSGFEGNNKYWQVSEDGQTIKFDFSDFDSYEQIINKFAEITGHTKSYIKTALADATVWSKDLENTLNNLQKVDILNDFLEGLRQDADENKNMKISTEQLEKIYNDSFKGQSKFTDFEDFKQAITKQVENSGYNTSMVEKYNTLDEAISAASANIGQLGKDSNATHGASVKIEGGTSGWISEDNSLTIHDYVQEEYALAINDALTKANFDLSNKNDIGVQHRIMTEIEKLAKTEYVNDLEKVYSVGKNEISVDGTTIEDSIADQYKEQLSQLYQAYVDNGYGSEQAINAIKEAYGTEDKIAAQFGLNQNVADFEDIIKPISKLFDESSQEYADWTQISITEDEVANINLAKMINEGTLKAIQFLLDAEGKKESYSELNEDNYLAARVKQLETQGYITNEEAQGDNENLITDFTAEDLGVDTTKTAEAYGKLWDEIMADSGQAIDFEWYYNFEKWGEKLSQNVENLSNVFDLAVKTLSKSTEELSQNLYDQYKNMELQKVNSQAKADAATQRMAGMLAKNEELTEYTWVDDNDVVQIDYDKLWAARSDENTSEKVKTLLEELETCADIIQENTSSQVEISNQQYEFLENITNTIIEFKNTVKELVVEDYQNQIDELQSIDTSINNANDKLINSIQNSVDRYRQTRDNEKTEQDITDKQRRLALLRADTSGANKTEILSLQKEIGEAQEDYTDTLIDQKISALQEQNEEASQQRQEQIDIANAQLDAAKSNGLINKEVQDILDKSQKYENSPLSELFTKLMGNNGLFKEEWATKVNDMEKNLAKFSGSETFSKQYMDGVADLKKGVSDAMSKGFTDTVDTINGSISKAVEGYKILSDTEYAAKVANIENQLAALQKANQEDSSKSETTTGAFMTSNTGHKMTVLLDTFHTNYKAKIWEKNKNQGEITEEDIKFLMGQGYSQNQVMLYAQWFKKNHSSEGNITKYAYASGGLNTQTGPAWLDGTVSKPELVLNAQDTENFLRLKDLLVDLNKNGFITSTQQNDGDVNLEIYLNVEQGLSNDYDVEQLVSKVKQEIAKVGQERNIQILSKR